MPASKVLSRVCRAIIDSPNDQVTIEALVSLPPSRYRASAGSAM